MGGGWGVFGPFHIRKKSVLWSPCFLFLTPCLMYLLSGVSCVAGQIEQQFGSWPKKNILRGNLSRCFSTFFILNAGRHFGFILLTDFIYMYPQTTSTVQYTFLMVVAESYEENCVLFRQLSVGSACQGDIFRCTLPLYVGRQRLSHRDWPIAEV